MSPAPDTLSPGTGLRSERMPGHWLLARLGKRVLRPGGRALTRWMLNALAITAVDRVVEFAPGIGATAHAILRRNPAEYIGVERDPHAAAGLQQRLETSASTKILTSNAAETGLADGCATVALGEAILSITTAREKQAIVAEAHRILAPGGRYAIHELLLTPDDLDTHRKRQVADDLSRTIHVGARPLTQTEWYEVLQAGGFRVTAVRRAPMRLLHISRFVADEGIFRSLRFVCNTLRDRAALKRVLEMNAVFRRHRRYMAAIAIVAVKE